MDREYLLLATGWIIGTLTTLLGIFVKDWLDERRERRRAEQKRREKMIEEAQEFHRKYIVHFDPRLSILVLIIIAVVAILTNRFCGSGGVPECIINAIESTIDALKDLP